MAAMVLAKLGASALVAIDVDAGGRAGSGDPERFALDLNVAAAHEAARQIRLRGLGGVIAIDFVSLRSKGHNKQLEEAVRAAFAGDPWSVQFGALSRFWSPYDLNPLNINNTLLNSPGWPGWCCHKCESPDLAFRPSRRTR
jgi:hypothetical protein